VRAAVREIHELCDSEHGISLPQLLVSELGDLRLQRLTGILLKRPFARAVSRSEPACGLGGRSDWVWVRERFEDPSRIRTGEYHLLEALRQTVPPRRPGACAGATWDDLLFEADHERGLYKILVRWLRAEIARQTGGTFRRLFPSGVRVPWCTWAEVADELAAGRALPLIFRYVPVAAPAAGLTLLGVRYGYLRLAAAGDRPDVLA
jgi:hypothetical protein